MLHADDRLVVLTDHTGMLDRLNFSFTGRGRRVWVDLKEMRQPYSRGI